MSVQGRGAAFVALLGLGAVSLAGCTPASGGSVKAEAPVPDAATPRLGGAVNVSVAPGDQGWLVLTPTGDDRGPGPNPDNVVGLSGQIDLNGDGTPETIQARMGGAAWSQFSVFEGDKPGATLLFTADGANLVVSKDRDVNGWPVLSVMVRDDKAKDVDAEVVGPEQVWTGTGYGPATPPDTGGG